LLRYNVYAEPEDKDQYYKMLEESK